MMPMVVAQHRSLSYPDGQCLGQTPPNSSKNLNQNKTLESTLCYPLFIEFHSATLS